MDTVQGWKWNEKEAESSASGVFSDICSIGMHLPDGGRGGRQLIESGFLARLHPAPKRKRRKRSWEDGWLPMERSIIKTPKGRNSKTPFGKFRESFIILTKTAAWNGMHLSGKTETFIMRMPKAHLPPDGKRSTKSSFILASGDGQCPALRPSTENSIIFPSAEKC